ncbi:MAG: hypothetical protein ACRCXZ_08810 [Patescibacteria group bacterium]
MTFSLPFYSSDNNLEDKFVGQVDLAKTEDLPEDIAAYVKEMRIPYMNCGFAAYSEDRFLKILDRKLLGLMRRILFRIYSCKECDDFQIIKVVSECLSRYVSVSTGTYFNEKDKKNEMVTISSTSIAEHLHQDQHLMAFVEVLSHICSEARFSEPMAKLFEYGNVIVLAHAIQQLHYFANDMEKNNNSLHADLVRAALKPDSDNVSNVFSLPTLSKTKKEGWLKSEEVALEGFEEVKAYIVQFYSPFNRFIQIHPNDNVKLFDTSTLGTIPDFQSLQYPNLLFNTGLLLAAWKTGLPLAQIAGFLPLPDFISSIIETDVSRPIAVFLVSYFFSKDNPFRVLFWSDACYEFNSLGQTIKVNKPRALMIGAMVVSVALV